MKLSAIVAMSQNRVIGQGGKLPWNLPEDLKRFRAITTGHPVIMGRKTFESIGRPLPKRENIIITRQPHYRAEGITVVGSLDEALAVCEGKSDEVFVIGGGEIYREAFPKIDRIYLTLIHSDFEGDAFFAEYNPDQFREVSREDRDGVLSYSFIVLDRCST